MVKKEVEVTITPSLTHPYNINNVEEKRQICGNVQLYFKNIYTWTSLFVILNNQNKQVNTKLLQKTTENQNQTPPTITFVTSDLSRYKGQDTKKDLPDEERRGDPYFRSAGVNTCTTDVPSENLVLKILFAFWNMPSFRDTTIN